MSSIAILDFDGVIVDNSIHTNIAQERARAFVREQALDLDRATERKALSTFFYSERGFFDTTLIEYDQLTPGCSKALTDILQEYDTVVILTSRPLSMREATLQWFSRWCPGYENIEFLFKDSDESVMKTAIWKASMVAQLVEHYDTLLFIDDDERNRKAVAALPVDLKNVTASVKSCFEECFPHADLP